MKMEQCSEMSAYKIQTAENYPEKAYYTVTVWFSIKFDIDQVINPLNAELNPICHFLALLGAHHILHISRVRVNFQGMHRLYVEKSVTLQEPTRVLTLNTHVFPVEP
jgi:hypothetical protein